MNEYIYKRRSVRNFNKVALNQNVLDQIQAHLKELTPLFKESPFSIELLINDEKERGKSYYLILRSQEDSSSLMNLGFTGQQMNLYLAKLGIGAGWKMTKPKGVKDKELPFIAAIYFGNTSESIYREQSEFKRKSLKEISEGTDTRLEAARLAPSGLNLQDWFFISQNQKIYCYRKVHNLLMSNYKNKLSRIDQGIALCHIYEESTQFQFVQEDERLVPLKKGYAYTGTVIS